MLNKSTIKNYTDVYFLRSLEILKQLNLNPFIRAQIFIRQGPGKVAGINESLEVIKNCSDLLKNKGNILSLKEGENYSANEVIMVLEGRIQDIIYLETVLLGIISSRTTQHNDKTEPDSKEITRRVKEIVSLVENRPVYYFGARHWHYSRDAEISEATFLGDAAGVSTLVGAETQNQAPIGTIPHSLETIFDWKYGKENAVVETTRAFDKCISVDIPRVALVDYANKEIDDSLSVAKILDKKLFAIRVDTAGENVMQGAKSSGTQEPLHFWYGQGVTISGIHSLRTALNKTGFRHVKIILSSGFGSSDKVKAFVDAEKKLKTRLFDALGIGNIFNSRIATMDIVGVGETLETLQPIAKTGRSYKPNSRLHLI